MLLIAYFLETGSHFSYLLFLCQFLIFTLDKLKCIGQLCILSYLCVRCIQLAKENVFFYGLIEKDRLLHHEADLATQLRDVIFVYVHTVNQHLAFVDIIKSQQKIGDGTFTAARVTYESYLFSCRNSHAKVFEHFGFSRRIVKGNVLELNGAFGHLFYLTFILPYIDFTFLVDH